MRLLDSLILRGLDMEENTKFTAPYVPFATFETALNHLSTLGAIQIKIDHNVFPSMGGLAKGQVISAFKFLGLIDANGLPQALLADLAIKKETRKATLRNIIKDRYPNVKESDLSAMSPGQLDAKLGDRLYNASGQTRIKARQFLLKAAENSGIPLSRLLTSKGPRVPRKKRASNIEAKSGSTEKAKQKEELTPLPNPESIRMPIALGPGRLAYIELPKDWEGKKETKKLLALLKLSLGQEEDILEE